MEQEPATFKGDVLVRGRGAIARGMTDPAPNETGYILMVNNLATDDFERIKRAVGVIVENGCSCDHAALICRIRGVPVVRLPVAFSRLHDGRVNRAAAIGVDRDECLRSLPESSDLSSDYSRTSAARPASLDAARERATVRSSSCWNWPSRRRVTSTPRPKLIPQSPGPTARPGT